MISRMARKSPRSYGSGGLQERNGKWIGHAVVRGKRVSKTLGPARAPSSGEGLTRRMAEDRLRAWVTNRPERSGPRDGEDDGQGCGERADRVADRRGPQAFNP